MTYAATTSVPVERSRAELERLLTRYGATRFASGWDEHGATVMFEAKSLRIRFLLPLPRADRDNDARHAQKCRARWRALVLCVKAKLEAVESGISSFENEFLAHVVLPGGQTVGDAIVPQIVTSYASGKMPPLLGA